jgi:glycosyltransferase involved in cell wall biosynthesis
MPSISVVTICFNNWEEVVETCASIDHQTEHPTEHWIIDGSTDNRIAGWLTTSPQPLYRRWEHIPNEGIVDSFNRGIQRSNSDFIQLLNSGDRYASNTVLESVKKELEKNVAAKWFTGKLITQRSGKMVEIGKPFEKEKLYRGMRSVSHPTWFVSKDVYVKHGLYNKDYKIAMDYDMMCRIADEPSAFMNIVVAFFDNTGISSVKYLQSLRENIKAYESHFGYSIKCRAWQFRLKLLYLLLQTGFGNWLFSIKKKMGLENA